MKMTKEGLALIRKFEGFRSTAYRCPAGIWTIGYGHTSMAGSPAVAGGMEISRAEAAAILAEDVARFAADVARLLVVRLADHQFSALVSFAYNVGIGNFRGSSVLKAVNCGDFAAVPRRLQLWTKAKGRQLPGLVRRRAAEAELFLGGAAITADDRPEVSKPAGKPIHHSTTALAALVSAIAGIASTVIAVTKEAVDAVGTPMGLILFGIIAISTLWIVRERWLKARDDGI
jgi:lysozyme